MIVGVCDISPTVTNDLNIAVDFRRMGCRECHEMGYKYCRSAIVGYIANNSL
jgi:hypothetical protein